MKCKRTYLVLAISLAQLAFPPLPTAALENPSPATPEKNAVSPVTSNLVFLLKTVNREGWEDFGTKSYQINDGKLILIDKIQPPASSDPAAAPSDSSDRFSISLSGNDLLVLQEFGCKALVQRVYKRGNRYITIQVYEFKKTEGANAGYDLLRKGSTTVIKRGDGSSEDGDSISFWKDRFFFVINATSRDDDESKEVVTAFANRLAEGRSRAQPPAILSRLPVLDRVRGTEKIVMGPVSASKYFSAPAVAALAIDKASGAAIADYQMLQPQRERMRLLYIDYSDATTAQQAYNEFVGKITELREPERGASGEARTLFRLNKAFLLCQLKLPNRIIVISGARKAKSAVLLADQTMAR